MKSNIIFIVLIIFSLFILGCSKGTQGTTTDETIETQQLTEEEPDAITAASVTKEEFLKHNTPEDCWIIYEGKIYDYSDAPRHPKIDETFFQHCGKPSGFEQGAKAQHSASSEDRVANYGTYVGDVGK